MGWKESLPENSLYLESDRGILYNSDVLSILKTLPDNSVDCIVTSPPYWQKRDYGDSAFTTFEGNPDCEHEWVEQEIGLQHENRNNVRGKQEEVVGKRGTTWIRKYDRRTALVCKKCGAWYGQLGLEPTPQMFVKHLVDIFREAKRVLKPTGNLFVNIDDTWVGGRYEDDTSKYAGRTNLSKPNWSDKGMPKRKSLALVPELFAVKMVYEENWILREKIIWSKKVFFYKENRTKGNAMPESVKDRLAHSWEYVFHFTKRQKYYFDWKSIAPPPSEDLVKRVQYGWDLDTPSKSDIYKRSTKLINIELAEKVKSGQYKVRPNNVVQINVKGFPEAHFAVFPEDLPKMLITLGCPEDGVVLDPFAGAGTTLLVADKLRRKWVGIELNPEYCEVINKRLKSQLRRKVLL